MKKQDGLGTALTCATSKKRLLRALSLAERLLLRRLERALTDEDEIDTLLSLASECALEEGMNEKTRRELLSRIESIRCEDLSKLCSIIGLLCEKEMLLGSGDGGESSAGAAAPCRFEEL